MNYREMTAARDEAVLILEDDRELLDLTWLM